MADRFVVRLNEDQRQFLRAVIDRGRCSPTTFIRALVLQRADASATGVPPRDDEIARATHASISTVYRVRKRFVEQGLNAALFPKDHPQPRRLLPMLAGN